ncbi:MAG: hypothetical protein U1C72_00270, partial [Candidatus Pacearchaeota archaeon]|nr:hypothetical protein [Candidatus Pacearchaeota archaeon]
MNINIQNAALLILTLITAAFLTSPILVALILLFFVLPGLVLSRLLPFQNLPWEVKVILAVSIGIAAIPLVTWLLKIFSLPLLSLTVIAFVALFAFAAARGIRRISFTFERRWRGFELLLIALLFLSLLSRLFPVNTLQVPPFADPALQGMITRIMTDQGGIPDTWSPFLPIAFNHQPGFASIIAWFSLLSSLPIPKLILYLTNIFHALFPFSLYLLAYALSQNRPASLISAALALIAIFPTSLFVAGANATVLMYPLAIVAAGTAILFLHEDTKQKRNGDAADLPTKLRSGIRHLLSYWNVLTALVILFAGSMLIHPTFAVFFGLIFGLYTLFLILQHKLDFIGRYALRLLLVFLAALVAGAIVAPFFLHSTPNKQLLEEQWEIQAEYVNPQHTISPYFFVEPIFFLFDNPQGAWYLELEKLSLRELFTHSVGILLSALFLYSLFFIWKKKDTTGYFLATLYVLFLALSSFQSVFELHFPGWNLLYPSRIKFLMVLPVALLIAFPFFRQSMRGFNIRHALLSLPILIIFLVTPYNLLVISRNLNALATLSPFSRAD